MDQVGYEKTQTIAEIKEQVQLAEWQRQIQARQEQGLTVDEWCSSLGISQTTYYYRLRKVREHLCQATEMLPKSANEHQIIPIQTVATEIPKSQIEIKLGELSVSFTGEASPDALKAVIEALRSC